MTSPLDSRYLNSPRSPIKDHSISPEKRLSFENLSRDEQDEITTLRLRISQMQSQQAERAYQYNEDCKSLELQVTNLRATVEKGEVLKQKLEYELTLVQRNLNNEKRKFSEKEANLQKLNSSLQEKINQLEDDVDRLQKSIKTEKEGRKEEAKINKEKETKKESENIQLKQMNKKLMESELILKQTQTDNEKYIKELQEKCKTLETQRDSQNDTIRRLMRDVEFASGAEERLESELVNYQERVKKYEDNIEAERSSHLETKFNFELLQVRIKELELTEETLKDCRKDLDNMSNNYKNLQQAMEDQVETCNELKNLMERKDHQHALEINEMDKQLQEVNKRENMLSEQLDIHQTNFDALRSELSEAKKHQTNVESTYSDNMKELDVILNNFRFEKSSDQEKKKETSKKKRRTSSSALEELRSILRDYQTRVMEANSQVDTLKKGNDSFANENQRLKQRLKEKDKTLEETRTQLKNSHLESARFKAECLKFENDRTQQTDDSNKLSKRLGDQKEKYHQLRLQMEDVQETLSKTQEDHEIFLYGIYQHLITGRPFIQSRRDRHVTSFSTSDLCDMIQEQIDFKLNALKLNEEKVLKLERNLEECEENYEKLKYSHEKNSNNSKEIEVELKQKINELEDHYKRKVHEIQKKTDKSKLTLDEVWMKLDKTKQSREELKVDNTKLKDSMIKLRNERGCLQMATFLLAGSLRTSSHQLADLSLQQAISNKLIKEVVYLKQQVADLVNILRTEIDGNDGNLRPKSKLINKRISGVLRFRRAVVVVLAANRFYNHANYASQYVKIGNRSSGIKSDHLLAVICTDKNSCQFKGLSERFPPRQEHQLPTVDWLTDQNFITVVTNSTRGLFEEIKKMSNPYPGTDGENNNFDEAYENQDYDKRPISVSNIKEEIRKSYKKLMKGIGREFPSSVYESKISLGGDSLIHQLNTGLRRVLLRLKDQREADMYSSSTCLAKSMNSYMLAYIERLHAAQVETKYLRQDIARLKGERDDIEHFLVSERELKASWAKEESSLRRKIGKLQKKMCDMVDAGKYDALVNDMRSAMEREEMAQKQLEDYTKQLEDIEKRVEKHSLEEKSKDSTMTETLKMLNNAKNEISKRDTTIKRLKNNADNWEKEKTLCQSNLEHLQKAYKAAVREREIVTSYIRAVGTVLEQSRQQAMLSSTDKFDFMLPELILPNEILVVDGIQISKEMMACQDTVCMFYQAQNLALQEISRLCNEKEQLTKKIDILSEEIRSQRDNVMQMRGEVNALKVANSNPKRDAQYPTMVKADVFKPVMNGLYMQDIQYPIQTFASSPPNSFAPILSSEKN